MHGGLRVQLLVRARPPERVHGLTHVAIRRVVGRSVVHALVPRVPDDVGVALAVHGVSLVLHARLLVRLAPLAFSAPLHTRRHHGAHQHQHGHGHGQRRHHEHLVGSHAFGIRGAHRVAVTRRVGGVCGVGAQRPTEGRRAPTRESTRAAHARAAVEARRRPAFVHVHAAVFARETRPTRASIVVDQVRAHAAVGARLGAAVVHLALAQCVHVAGHALAAELVHQVDARAAVEAGVASAVVHVHLAARPRETRGAVAFVAAHAVHAAAPVQARRRRAVVHLALTVDAVEAGRTATRVPARGRLTRGAVAARTVVASLSPRLAARPVPPPRTDAAPAAHAAAAVEARVVRAVVDLAFAVRPRVTWRTAARVRALTGVVAGPAVATRLVVGAVVEVLVAEEAAPAFVAKTVPRLLAGAVQTARVPLTLVAQPPLPAAVAAATKEMGAVFRVRDCPH